MPVTAEQVQALRRRQAEAERKRAEAAGRLQSASGTVAALEQRMRDECGCDDLPALEARIATKRQALDEAAAAADGALREVEAVLP